MGEVAGDVGEGGAALVCWPLEDAAEDVDEVWFPACTVFAAWFVVPVLEFGVGPFCAVVVAAEVGQGTIGVPGFAG